MCSIFERTLQTDQEKALSRHNESTFDSQAIYKALSECYEKKEKASLDAPTLLAYVTTTRIDEWKGTIGSFILNCQEKVKEHELLVKSEEKFSDAIKLTMLQNSVSPVDHLKQVKETAQQLKFSLFQDLIFDGYEKLLKETAFTHD